MYNRKEHEQLSYLLLYLLTILTRAFETCRTPTEVFKASGFCDPSFSVKVTKATLVLPDTPHNPTFATDVGFIDRWRFAGTTVSWNRNFGHQGTTGVMFSETELVEFLM